jgi:hypothetical protein
VTGRPRMANSGYFSEWPVTCDAPGSLAVMKAFVRIPAATESVRRCTR